jgi:hypothetical protein
LFFLIDNFSFEPTHRPIKRENCSETLGCPSDAVISCWSTWVKTFRRILVDVIQGCDKSAIEKSLLLVATVCAVSVVIVIDCLHDERHADEAIAYSPARSLSVCI